LIPITIESGPTSGSTRSRRPPKAVELPQPFGNLVTTGERLAHPVTETIQFECKAQGVDASKIRPNESLILMCRPAHLPSRRACTIWLFRAVRWKYR
jgi:hypothetical protein